MKNVRTRQILALVLSLVMFISVGPVANAAGVPGKGVYPDNNALPEFYGVPDLMTFNDGSRVLTESDWILRRAEVFDAVQYYEYGYVHIPEVFDVVRGGTAAAPTISYKMRSWAPTSATDPTPMERVVQAGPYTFSFNAADPVGSRNNMPLMIGAAGRPGQAAITSWPAGAGDTTRNGLYFSLYPFYGPSSYNAATNTPYNGGVYDAPYDGMYDTGTLIANGWNIGRIIDALLIAQTLGPDGTNLFPEIDPYGITPYGFSRGGKNALMAAIQDDRVAMGYSGHGGQGANSSLRMQNDSKKVPAGGDPGNTIYTAQELARDAGLTGYEDLSVTAITNLLKSTTMFSSRTNGRQEQLGQNQGSYGPWYSTRFQYFNNQNAGRYPIDHHFTLSLMAPRPMLGAEGMWDMWNDPESANLMYECARPVWELYGHPERLAFLCSPYTAHQNAAIERRTADALFDYVYGDKYTTGGNSMKKTMSDLLYDPVANPNGIMREKPADMLWTTYVGNSGYIPVNFNLSAFTVIDPTAITSGFPGQYSLSTNGTYDGEKVYHTRSFIEGLKTILPVTSDAPAVDLYDANGVLIQTQKTDKQGNAVFTIMPDQAKAGVYTFKTVGSEKISNEHKIECWTWEFAMRPELCYDESTYVYWKWPAALQRDVRPGPFRNPYLGQEPSAENYVPALANNVKVWLEDAQGNVAMDYKTLRTAMKAAVSNNTPMALDTNEHKLEVQRYGVMITTYGGSGTAANVIGGNVAIYNPATGTSTNKTFPQATTVHIDGMEFPTLFDGFTFDYTGPAPTGSLATYFAN